MQKYFRGKYLYRYQKLLLDRITHNMPNRETITVNRFIILSYKVAFCIERIKKVFVHELRLRIIAYWWICCSLLKRMCGEFSSLNELQPTSVSLAWESTCTNVCERDRMSANMPEQPNVLANFEFKFTLTWENPAPRCCNWTLIS